MDQGWVVRLMVSNCDRVYNTIQLTNLTLVHWSICSRQIQGYQVGEARCEHPMFYTLYLLTNQTHAFVLWFYSFSNIIPHIGRLIEYSQQLMLMAGNTEQGKCRLTNEYLFFLFLIGHWYNEKKYFVFIKTTYSSRFSFVACNSWYA
jgi:hypothetical protein